MRQFRSFTACPLNKKRNFRKLLISCCIFGGISILLFITLFNKECQLISSRTVINPPELSEDEKLSLWDLISDDEEEALKKDESLTAAENKLSNIVQKQIHELQNADCSAPNFICGHVTECGVGCQIHHRIGCVMMSYVLNMSFIHDETTAWLFSKPWTHAFQAIGSKCSPGPNTYRWSWRGRSSTLSKFCHNYDFGWNTLELKVGDLVIDKIHYPLGLGISVSEELETVVEKLHPDSFMWWVGQFTKYVMRLNPVLENDIQKYKEKIGFHSPIVGVHVRRTDKIEESTESHHEIETYFTAAEAAFKYLEGSLQKPLERRIFIASDDVSILPEARAKYVTWDIYGFPENTTRPNPNFRRDTEALDGIIRDIMLLTECDYIICGFSSNVCRLLLEMFNYKHVNNAKDKFTSLDGNYSFVLFAHSIQKEMIWKIKSKLTTTEVI